MSAPRSRQVTTSLLVAGAVLFGMVLAGGLQLTVPGMTAAEQPMSATQVVKASNTPVRGLPSFADLAQAVDPAVVSIQAATIEKEPRNRRGNDPLDFFRNFGPRQQDPRESPDGRGGRDPEDFRSDAGGSGFVISPDGLVVTNYHVIEGASEVKVHLGDRDYPAEVKGTDQATDIALLKIDAGRSLRYLELGDSERVRVGDWIMVIGNPLNLDKTVTTGVVSAKGRSLGISDISFENFIQTDAAINFGNSGGPLVNLEGEVVAIATAINYGAENIGFAVPVNTLREILPQLRDKGKVSRGYLGIAIGPLDYKDAEAWNLPSTDGALVGDVQPDTPAGKAGVRHGDIIIAVDGHKVVTTRDLINYVSAQGPDATVKLTLLREGERLERSVKLGERPSANAEASVAEPEQGRGIDWLGIEYQDLSGGLRQMHGIGENIRGVWVTGVEPNSPLYDELVRPGNVITEVNGKVISGVADFEDVVRGVKSGSFLRLYVLRLPRSGQGGQGDRPQPFFAVVKVP